METRDAEASLERHCLPANLGEARIQGDDLPLPRAFYYIPSFITPAEEEQLLRKVYSCPAPLWRVLPTSLRRLQSHPSELLPRTNALIDAPLPAWLEEPIVSRVLSIPLEKAGATENVFSSTPHKKPNHVLVNEYTVDPPQGILDHEDGPAYAPVTCTVSLGGSCVLEVREKEKEGERKRWRIFIEGRSLLLTTGTAYQYTLHGIEACTEDRIRANQTADEGVAEFIPIANLHMLGGTYEDVVERTNRVSLTYRDVLNVKSVNLKALGLGMGKMQR